MLFTLRVPDFAPAEPRLTAGGATRVLEEVTHARRLDANTWLRDGKDVVICFDLQKGPSRLDG